MAKVNGATLMARSLKQQGVEYMFGIVGFPVQPIAAAAQKAGITLYRHAQRAVGLLCRPGRRLSDRPAGRRPGGLRPRRGARPRRAWPTRSRTAGR